MSEKPLPAGVRIGAEIRGTVVRHAPFGVFIDTDIGIQAVAERIIMARDGLKTPEEYPAVGERVLGKVVGYRHYCHQIEFRYLRVLPPRHEDGSAFDPS